MCDKQNTIVKLQIYYYKILLQNIITKSKTNNIIKNTNYLILIYFFKFKTLRKMCLFVYLVLFFLNGMLMMVCHFFC